MAPVLVTTLLVALTTVPPTTTSFAGLNARLSTVPAISATPHRAPRTSGGVTVINDGSFSSPSAITSNGSDVWVANSGGTSSNPSVTKINATTGVVTPITNSSFQFPTGIVADGSVIWVADAVGGTSGNGSVEEINATTDAVTEINNTSFESPWAIASSGADVWVANQSGGTSGNGSVSEINTTTGAVTQINDPSFNSPSAIAADATHVWVANSAGGSLGNGSVSQIDIASGAVIQINDVSFNNPNGISADGTNVWVANLNGGASGSGSLSKIEASNGAVIDINSPNFNPDTVVSNGTDVWVPSYDSIAQYVIATGASATINDPSFSQIAAATLDGTTLWVANSTGGAEGNGSVTELTTTPNLPKPSVIVPGAPTALHAQAGALSVHLTWNAPQSDGGSAITTYVARSHPGSFSCTSTALSCTMSGLSNGVAYTFTVIAANANGRGMTSTASTVVRPTALTVTSRGTHPLAIEFAVPGVLPKATIGSSYSGYSFCQPGVAPGNFCGGPFNHPTNPRGGPADENYEFSARPLSPAPLGCHCFKPIGLNLDFLTGRFAGTPALGGAAGTYHFYVCAQVVFEPLTMSCDQTSITLEKKKLPVTTTTTTPKQSANPYDGLWTGSLKGIVSFDYTSETQSPPPPNTTSPVSIVVNAKVREGVIGPFGSFPLSSVSVLGVYPGTFDYGFSTIDSGGSDSLTLLDLNTSQSDFLDCPFSMIFTAMGTATSSQISCSYTDDYGAYYENYTFSGNIDLTRTSTKVP